MVVAAVADEEHASVGAEVPPPTSARTSRTEVAIAHRGFVWIEVRVARAHGSRPQGGRDRARGPILTGIGPRLRLAGAPSLLDRGSIHASLIEGGTELSSYPDRCRISLERRTLPGEGAASVEAEIEEILAGTRSRVPGLGASQRTLLVREPFEIDADAELVGIMAAAHAEQGLALHRWRQLLGGRRVHRRGGPVLFGPAGEGAHRGWVSLSSCEAVRATLVEVARHICR